MSETLDRYEREYLEFHNITKERRWESLRHLGELEARAGVSMEHVGPDVVRAYITDLAVGRLPSTVGKILKMIRPFYNWAWETGLIDAQRLMEIKAVRPPRGASAPSRPRPYSRDEIRLLWRDWDRHYALPKGVDEERALWFVTRWENGTSRWGRVRPLAWRYQSRAIVSLAMMGGLRLDEIYRLSVNDIHPDNAYVVVTGVRKNQAGVPIQRAVPWTTPAMREAITDWVNLRDRIQPGHDRAWLSMYNTPHIRTPIPHRRFEMLMKKMGRGWGYHRLRHTAATEMLRSGYPLETVQKVMGHSRITQTLAYAELLTDDVVRVAGRCEMQLTSALDALALEAA